MKLRLMLPALVVVFSAASGWQGYYALELASGVVAVVLILIALMIPDAA